jgi:hypothetical protein
MSRLALPFVAIVIALGVCSGPSSNRRQDLSTPPDGHTTSERHDGGRVREAANLDGRVEVPPPPFTEGIFPCSSCHAGLAVNRTRRELTEMHGEIVLAHDEEHRWCLDCHDADDRDRLHLAGGQLVPFDQSYVLCGQCHGEKLRDWKAGVHGRRSQQWNGHKTYLLCAHCHDPHGPRFAPIEPKPAPRRPAPPGW